MKEVLFDLSDEALNVANSGQPFTREGVIGICASHISEKRNNHSDDYKCADKDLIPEIQGREIETYKINRNRVVEDANQEDELSHDYGGRFAWELLQNADDVMGPPDRRPAELIGTKGLGFKSVLEITEEPEIYSVPFNFRFSPDNTQRLLKREGIHKDPPRLTFRIPHSCEPTGKVRELLDMGYSTVVRLPFRDEVAQEKAKKILKNLDPCFLLLSQQIETVRIIQDGEERIFSIRRGVQGLSDGRVVLEGPNSRTDWRRWVATQDIPEAKRITVAIAIPLNENGEAVPHTDELPVHVFFPTEELSGVKALIHTSFDLEQNRKHLRQGDHDEAILVQFGDLLERLILDIPPHTVLKIFGDIDQPEEDGGKPIEKIKKTIWEKMRTTPFLPVLGGKRVCPPDSTCWKDKLGQVLRGDEKEVQEANLVTPALSSLSNVLKKLGASEIRDNQFTYLLRYCRNESLDDCIFSFHVLLEGGLNRVQESNDEETLNLLRQVPCWWTEDAEARQLGEMPPLLWKKPEDWPGWLAVDTLHPQFRMEIEKWKKKYKEAHGQSQTSKLKKWENFIERFLSRKKEHYIDWVLVPHIKSWDKQVWERQGFDVLTWLMRWESQHEFEKTTPCIRGAGENEEDRRRNALAAALRLPTDKGWLPAIDCFAGKAWEGPEAFYTFYQDRIERGIVQSFEKWPGDLRGIDKRKWKSLLRWIGVSWEPKVCHRRSFEIEEHKLWDNYVKEHSAWHTSGKSGHNYYIEDFPKCVNDIERNVLIRDIFPQLQELTSRSAKRFYRTSKQSKSLAFYQLTHEAWLSVKKSLLEDRSHIPPNEAFLPGEGLNGLLPEVDKSGIDEDTWHGKDGIKAKLVILGVMESLPDSSEKWYEWMRSLAEVGKEQKEEREAPVDWKDSGGQNLWPAARSLYREYLKNGDFGVLPKDVQIPCVCFENTHRLLNFAKPEEVHWIDEAHLADVTLENELLSQGYKLFIFRLQETAEISKLRVKKLSNIIECTPQYNECGSSGNEEYELYQRYKVRRIVLNKVKNIQLPEKLDIKAVRNLTLKLSTNGSELGDCFVLSWIEMKTGYLLVDIEKNKWRALADALAHRLQVNRRNYSQFANDFEVYLADDDDDSILERMRSEGIPEEALEEVKMSISPLNGPPAEINEIDEDQIKDKEKSDTGPEQPPISNGAASVNTVSEDSESTRNRAGSGGRDTPARVSKSPSNQENNNAPRPETGLTAENWLGDRLRDKFGGSVDKVHTGSDFILKHDGQEIYVEAKHVETRPGSIHWSRRQFETCQKKNSYFIALLSPGEKDSDQYDIHWIWDPLVCLMKLDRRVIWNGKSSPQLLQKDKWEIEITKPTKLAPDSFDIEIVLADYVFNYNDQDNHMLENLIKNLNTRR